MIVIMWLTGGKKQLTPAKASAPVLQQPLPVEVNENEDCRSSESNPRAPARAARCAECPGAAEQVPGRNNSRQQQAQTSYAPSNAAGERTEDPIKAERRKREYLSLFASNIALSYRKAAPATQAGPPESSSQSTDTLGAIPPNTSTEASSLSQMLKDAQLGIAAQPISATQPNVVTSTQTHNPSANVAEANKEARRQTTLPPRR